MLSKTLWVLDLAEPITDIHYHSCESIDSVTRPAVLLLASPITGNPSTSSTGLFSSPTHAPRLLCLEHLSLDYIPAPPETTEPNHDRNQSPQPHLPRFSNLPTPTVLQITSYALYPAHNDITKINTKDIQLLQEAIDIVICSCLVPWKAGALVYSDPAAGLKGTAGSRGDPFCIITRGLYIRIYEGTWRFWNLEIHIYCRYATWPIVDWLGLR